MKCVKRSRRVRVGGCGAALVRLQGGRRVGTEVLRGTGGPEQEPLPEIATHPLQRLELGRPLDPLGDASAGARARARLTIAVVIASLSARSPTPATNDRSIFSASTGSRCRYASDE